MRIHSHHGLRLILSSQTVGKEDETDMNSRENRFEKAFKLNYRLPTYHWKATTKKREAKDTLPIRIHKAGHNADPPLTSLTPIKKNDTSVPTS